ncbi:MAG: hypothetical protein EHM35_01905 [Planctomycetaceae bacterium]|nr:MAG: hypothetical protein EHM35_01905 [Planctomycetaceae bacterium]
MNRTQKCAWFTLGISSLLILFLAFVLRSMFVPGDRMAGVGLVMSWLWLILLFMVGSLFLVFYRQSQAEPAADERDRLIKRNAVLASFIGVWILLAMETVLPRRLAGDAGSIPVAALPIINTAILFTAMLVYSVAVLVQYGRGVENEQ